MGVPETYADCASSGRTPEKVARQIVNTPKIAFVYFMLRESNFFTINRVSSAIPRYSMHAMGRNREHAADRSGLTLGAVSTRCQVTKGAHVWSWHKTCNLKGLHHYLVYEKPVSSVVEPSSPVNIVASAIAFFLTILVEE